MAAPSVGRPCPGFCSARPAPAGAAAGSAAAPSAISSSTAPPPAPSSLPAPAAAPRSPAPVRPAAGRLRPSCAAAAARPASYEANFRAKPSQPSGGFGRCSKRQFSREQRLAVWSKHIDGHRSRASFFIFPQFSLET